MTLLAFLVFAPVLIAALALWLIYLLEDRIRAALDHVEEPE